MAGLVFKYLRSDRPEIAEVVELRVRDFMVAEGDVVLKIEVDAEEHTWLTVRRGVPLSEREQDLVRQGVEFGRQSR